MIMFEAQARSGPTAIGWSTLERTVGLVTMRETGNGQSLQCFRKKKTKGRQVSKKVSQLETTTATELANAFSSGICHSCGNEIHSARNFFRGAMAGLRERARSRMLAVSQKRGLTGFYSLFEAQAACRGWFVRLVKIRTKT